MPLQPQDRDSIFGNTYCGVPNPYAPNVTPYPTRLHGPVWRYPQQGGPFVSTPHEVPQRLAIGMLPSPDGIGDTALIFQNVTGSSYIDAALGAAAGYLVAEERDRLAFALAGGLLTAAAGFMGLASTVGLALWRKRR